MPDFLQRLKSLFTPAKPARRDPFLDLVDAFAERSAAWPKGAPAGGRRIGVLVTPWLSTAVPFFALECAEMLRRSGNTPVILFDPADVIQNSPEAAHAAALTNLIRENFTALERFDAAGVMPQPDESDVEFARPIFRENAIWRSRGEVKAEEFMAGNSDVPAAIAKHLAVIRGVLKASSIDRILIPGGFFGLSALYVAIARQLGMDFATFDGSSGVLRLTQRGIAAHLADVPAAFYAVKESLTTETRAEVLSMGRAELDDRCNARDFRHFQVAAATGRDDLQYDIFVPLNIRWDSAALGRQRAFETVGDWLDSLLGWVASKPDVSICIRQHPRERLDFAKGSDNLAPLLAKHAGLGGRLRFVAADEELNSYDLLRFAKVVLPHTSTVGIEAALLGLPVILGTAVYYEDLGFCKKAATREEYFTDVEAALAGAFKPDAAQQDDAALAYYLTQRCALLQTKFTAHPDDFRSWVKVPHEELWEQPEAADFRAAFLSGEPLSVIRHRRKIHAD